MVWVNALLAALACSMLALPAWAIPSSNDYKVTGLNKYGARDEMYSGLMPLDWTANKFGSLFFWLVKQRHNTTASTVSTAHEVHKPKKLVIWLNGGPGCSSMVGMMWENGPFTINFGEGEHAEKYNLRYNPYSWNEAADMLFVEQPLRTGFSVAAKRGPRVYTEEDVGIHFRKFLLSFMEVFPEYKGVDMYISGESYAGFYIPWMAEIIVRNQMVTVHGKTFRDPAIDNLNLVGVAIGNGVMDYMFQEPSYAEYAYTHGLIPLGAKMKIDREWKDCLEQLTRERGRLSRKSFDQCNMMGKVLEAAGQPNEYNTATFVGYDQIIKKGGPFDTFFQDPEIQASLHVRGYNIPGLNFIPERVAAPLAENIPIITSGPVSVGTYFAPENGWNVCSDDVDGSLYEDHPTSVVSVLQGLIDFEARDKLLTSSNTIAATNGHLPKPIPRNNEIQVLLYSGEFDLNCNTLGTLHTLEANRWRNKRWSHASRSLWRFNNDVAGQYFTIDNLFSFLIVRNSGHLLPMDLPANALEMLRRFLYNQSFADTVLPNELSYIIAMEEAENSTTSAQSHNVVAFVMLTLVLVCIAVGTWYLVQRQQQTKVEVFKNDLQADEEVELCRESKLFSSFALNNSTRNAYQPIN